MKRLATIAAASLLCLAGSAQSVTQRLLPPGSFEFFKGAVRSDGVFPAILSTSDYMMRSGRIGSAQRHPAPEVPAFTSGSGLPSPSREPSLFASKDIDFVDYLIGNGMESDAATLLTRGPYHVSDTLRYLQGWACYSAKQLDLAAEAFSLVPQESPFHDKSLFYNVVSNAHMGRYGRSSELLDSYHGPYRELKGLQQAGIALLEGRKDGFILASGSFTFSQYALTESENALKGIFEQRYGTRGRSPLLAAAASAVVPGLGKVYAGRTAEGIAAFLTVGSLAAITAENWTRHGVKDWKTILFGALGTIFYIGNIYGSYISVSIQNNELKDAQDTAILYHIHIPLRSVFQ